MITSRRNLLSASVRASAVRGYGLTTRKNWFPAPMGIGAEGFCVPTVVHTWPGARACGLAFSDSHSVIHKWRGSKISAPVRYNGGLSLNVPAGDSWMNVNWMADNTTVHK